MQSATVPVHTINMVIPISDVLDWHDPELRTALDASIEEAARQAALQEHPGEKVVYFRIERIEEKSRPTLNELGAPVTEYERYLAVVAKVGTFPQEAHNAIER